MEQRAVVDTSIESDQRLYPHLFFCFIAYRFAMVFLPAAAGPVRTIAGDI
jgi:hypothetical protein